MLSSGRECVCCPVAKRSRGCRLLGSTAVVYDQLSMYEVITQVHLARSKYTYSSDSRAQQQPAPPPAASLVPRAYPTTVWHATLTSFTRRYEPGSVPLALRPHHGAHAGRPHVLPPDVCEIRYMHGPIPMKLECCQAEMVRVCLSPAQILRQGSVQAIIVGLRTLGRRTHEDEWDEVRTARLCLSKTECLPTW